MIEKLSTQEHKEIYDTIIKPIYKGDTIGIYPTDNSLTAWSSLQYKITLFNNHKRNRNKANGLFVEKKVQEVINNIGTENLKV